ncbi:MAG: hypothetical protein KC503_32600 [Myxococcales bacterium]|nr:hypothetical protein [Myxococcales bacterium]
MRTSLSILVLVVAASGLVTSCAGSDERRTPPCQAAVELWNGCASADRQDVFGVPKLQWNGPCQDGVDFVIDTGNTIKVNLKTWADAYTQCQARGDVMPFTCMCPGVPFVIPTYQPPATCGDFTPEGVADVCTTFNESYVANTPQP